MDSHGYAVQVMQIHWNSGASKKQFEDEKNPLICSRID